MSRLTRALVAAAVSAAALAGLSACGEPPYIAGANICKAQIDWWGGASPYVEGNVPSALMKITCGPNEAYMANARMLFKVWRTRWVEDGPRKILVDIEPAAFLGGETNSGPTTIEPGGPSFMQNWLECITGTFAYQPVLEINLPWYAGPPVVTGSTRFLECENRAVVKQYHPAPETTPVQQTFSATNAQHRKNYDAGIAKLRSVESQLMSRLP